MEEQKRETGQPSDRNDHHCAMYQGYGCCGRHCRHFILRWVLGLIILAIAFGIGVKVGEFKGAFGGDYGYYGHGYMYPEMHRPALYQQRFQYVPQSGTQTQGPAATTSPKASSTK